MSFRAQHHASLDRHYSNECRIRPVSQHDGSEYDEKPVDGSERPESMDDKEPDPVVFHPQFDQDFTKPVVQVTNTNAATVAGHPSDEGITSPNKNLHPDSASRSASISDDRPNHKRSGSIDAERLDRIHHNLKILAQQRGEKAKAAEEEAKVAGEKAKAAQDRVDAYANLKSMVHNPERVPSPSGDASKHGDSATKE